MFSLYVQVKEYFTLHWAIGRSQDRRRLLVDAPTIVPDEGEIMFAMEGKTNGWVSLGFAEKAGSMVPADAVIGWINDDDGQDVTRSYRITVSISAPILLLFCCFSHLPLQYCALLMKCFLITFHSNCSL